MFEKLNQLSGLSGFGAMGPKKTNPRFFKRKLKHKSVRLFCLWDHMDFFFSMKWPNNHPTTPVRLFNDHAEFRLGTLLRYQLPVPEVPGWSKGVQGPTVQLMTFSPFPLLSVPRTLTKVQTLLPWQKIASHAANPLEFGQKQSHFFSLVDSMLQPFVCQLGTSNAIHALWRFSFTTSSAGCWHHEKCPCGIFTVADLRRDTALISG